MEVVGGQQSLPREYLEILARYLKQAAATLRGVCQPRLPSPSLEVGLSSCPCWLMAWSSPLPPSPSWLAQKWISELAGPIKLLLPGLIIGTQLVQLAWNEILWSVSGVCTVNCLGREREGRRGGRYGEKRGKERGEGEEKVALARSAAFPFLEPVLHGVRSEVPSLDPPQDTPLACQYMFLFCWRHSECFLFFSIICN